MNGTVLKNGWAVDLNEIVAVSPIGPDAPEYGGSFSFELRMRGGHIIEVSGKRGEMEEQRKAIMQYWELGKNGLV